MKLTNLPKEGIRILIAGLLAFVILVSFTSCSTTSQLGCSDLLGPEKDRCMEEYRVNEAQYERHQREFGGSR